MSTSVNDNQSNDNDEKQISATTESKSTGAVAIDANAKGLESFNKYIQQILQLPELRKCKFLQLSSISQFLEKCQENGIIDADIDLCDISEDEEEADKILDKLPLRVFVDNLEYLFINEKVGIALNDVQRISYQIGDGFENTHTGNLKADAFEQIVKKIKSLIKKKDFQKAFGYALGFTYVCLDDTNGNGYWLNDNECTDEIDENILKPMGRYWSQLLKKTPYTTLGCISDGHDATSTDVILVSYLKRVQGFINETFEWYEELKIKFPSN